MEILGNFLITEQLPSKNKICINMAKIVKIVQSGDITELYLNNENMLINESFTKVLDRLYLKHTHRQ